MSQVHANGGRIGILGLLGVVFITLKLCGVIDWSWWWVTAPLWIPVALVATGVLILGVLVMVKSYRQTGLLIAVCGLLSGCAMDRTYVEADRATYNAIAPEFLRYVAEDPRLDPVEKALRAAAVGLWDERIAAEERRGAPASKPAGPPASQPAEDDEPDAAGIKRLAGQPGPGVRP